MRKRVKVIHLSGKEYTGIYDGNWLLDTPKGRIAVRYNHISFWQEIPEIRKKDHLEIRSRQYGHAFTEDL